jgi:hypothetical protein
MNVIIQAARFRAAPFFKPIPPAAYIDSTKAPVLNLIGVSVCSLKDECHGFGFG